MGDPLEANAAGEFYARKDDHLIIGSVKGNIGWVAGFVSWFNLTLTSRLCRCLPQPPRVHGIPRIVDKSVPDPREEDDLA